MIRKSALIGIIMCLVSCSLMDPAEPGNLVPRTVDEDPSLPSLEVNGTNLHLQTFGNSENPVLIFLHGGPGGDHRSLLRLKDRYNDYSLVDEYYCVFYDQRGAGLSRRHGLLEDAFDHDVKELFPEVYLADLHAIVEHFSPDDKVILMGHSWGGAHATYYVNTYPEKVAAVIVSEPGPFHSDDADAIPNVNIKLFNEGVSDAMWNSQFISANDHESADYNFLTIILAMNPIDEYHFVLDEKESIKFWRYGAVANLNDLGNAINDNGEFHYDFTNNLSNFTTKALCINGSLNEILTVEFQEDNMARYPNYEIRIIEDVGHDLMWIRADKHVEYIKEYLDEVL